MMLIITKTAKVYCTNNRNLFFIFFYSIKQIMLNKQNMTIIIEYI